MHIKIPNPSLVVLIGPSGAGKSTFARQRFRPSEVLSSEACRALVSDDEHDPEATRDAREVMHCVVGKRLARSRLTVVDATNVQPAARGPLVQLAREHDCPAVAIVLDLAEAECHERNRSLDRQIVARQRAQLRRSLPHLRREGFHEVYVLDRVEEIESATVERVGLRNDRRDEHGPFDFIGDIHGCCDELEELLAALGYERHPIPQGDAVWGDSVYRHPEQRRAVFVGDLVDRGPRVLDAVRTVRNMVRHGAGLCVPGNHDAKLVRKLRGRNVQIKHGLAQSLAEIEALPRDQQTATRKGVMEFLDSLASHYVLDDGKVVVAHAGMKEALQGRESRRVRDFALYGETTGEIDEFGLPVRLKWAAHYRGSALVVYGHTPVAEPEWLNHTVNIDTGCVFGGKLTAFRYPEQEFVSIPAKRIYCPSARPFLEAPG